jgi:hypothetical protein
MMIHRHDSARLSPTTNFSLTPSPCNQIIRGDREVEGQGRGFNALNVHFQIPSKSLLTPPPIPQSKIPNP